MKGLTPIINDTVNTETTCFLQTHIDNTLIPTQVHHSHWKEERRGERGGGGRGEERGEGGRRGGRYIYILGEGKRRGDEGEGGRRGEERKEGGRQSRRILRMTHKQDM